MGCGLVHHIGDGDRWGWGEAWEGWRWVGGCVVVSDGVGCAGGKTRVRDVVLNCGGGEVVWIDRCCWGIESVRVGGMGERSWRRRRK